MPQLRSRRRRDDRGAVATVVAILLAGGVLLGFAALVVDVGQIYAERAELQTGADAAAMAVARACSVRDVRCANGARVFGLAQEYADANSSDGVSSVVDVCGRLPGVLSGCDPPNGNLTDCLGAPPESPTTYVEVRLATELPGERFALPPTFAHAMAGSSGFDGVSVGACARARWEPADNVGVLAMTVSICEYADMALDDDEYVVNFLEGAHGQCDTRPGGVFWRPAGPAGWLRDTGQCMLVMPASGVVRGMPLFPPDHQPPGPCLSRLQALVAGGDTVWIPVHDARRARGVRYRHVRVVPVKITGYFFGEDDAAPSDDPPCADGQRCVSLTVVGPSEPISSLAGNAIVRLIG